MSKTAWWVATSYAAYDLVFTVLLRHVCPNTFFCSTKESREQYLILRRGVCNYSRTSLSRTRLFRITAYLEVKIWSLFQHETMTTVNKIMWKRGEFAPKEQILLFFTLFYIYISNLRSQITHLFVKCGCSIRCFPHSLNSDMSRYGYLEVFHWVPWNSR